MKSRKVFLIIAIYLLSNIIPAFQPEAIAQLGIQIGGSLGLGLGTGGSGSGSSGGSSGGSGGGSGSRCRAVARNATVTLDATGHAYITPSTIDGGCTGTGISLTASSTIFTCANLGTNIVTLTVVDIFMNISVATAVVTVTDNTPPVVRTRNITVSVGASGSVTIQPSDVDGGSYDNCGIASMSLSRSTFYCSNLGNNTVILTVTDYAGNSSSAAAVVTVVDANPPTVLTKNAVIYLNSSNTATLSVSQVNNGTYDNCCLAAMSLSKTYFTCADAGYNTVFLTASDCYGNTASAAAIVEVKEMVPPVAIAKSAVLYLDQSGTAYLSAYQVDGGSYDNCGIASETVSKSVFTCADLGANYVTLTVTDRSGNSSSAVAVVYVQDNIPPTAIATNVTAYLDAGGYAYVTASQVGYLSYDNCGIALMSLSKTTFTCADLGANVVVLTVRDRSGNTAYANAVVTVADVTPPTITVTLTPEVITTCNHSLITVNAVVNVTDNCGVGTYYYLASVTSSENDCGYDIYDQPNDIQGCQYNTSDCSFQLRAERYNAISGRIYAVTYVAVDGHGNTATAIAYVTVPFQKSTSPDDENTPMAGANLDIIDIHPNPFSSAVNFDYTVNSGGRVKVEVFNSLGELVRTLSDQNLDAGTYSLNWDGTDSKGNQEGNGIYFVRVSDMVDSKVQKIELLR